MTKAYKNSSQALCLRLTLDGNYVLKERFFFAVALRPNAGHGPLILEVF